MDDFIHNFIFSPGHWSGKGKISVNMLEEELIFDTRWSVQSRDFTGKVECVQDIQVQGLSENMSNKLSFSNFQATTFTVEMDNPNVGQITGTGVFDDHLIGWEFRNNAMNFEGFETYHLQPDGSYLMHGEYVTSDQFRTQIDAQITACAPPDDSENPPFHDEDEPNEGDENP